MVLTMRPSRTSMLKPGVRPVLPPPVEPQDGYTEVGPMAMLDIVKDYQMDRAVHIENTLRGTLVDLSMSRHSPYVDPWFVADLACARVAAWFVAHHRDKDYVLTTLPKPKLPVVLEIYPDVVEVRIPTDAEMD